MVIISATARPPFSPEDCGRNRVTLDQVAILPLGEIAALPVDQLVLLLDDLAEEKARLKTLDDRLTGALSLRYGERANALRKARGKEAGVVRIEEADGFAAICDVAKKPEYDQTLLLQAVSTLQSWGLNPDEFVTREVKVSETRFNAWPSQIRRLFEPARTLKLGRPSFRLERAKTG